MGRECRSGTSVSFLGEEVAVLLLLGDTGGIECSHEASSTSQTLLVRRL